MSKSIYGMHDIGGAHLYPGGVTVVTEGIGRDPNDRNGAQYNANNGERYIVRLNHGYGSSGTLPLPQYYPDFAKRFANFVAGSSGCTDWIVANEVNHQQEWPDGQVIYPDQYAACFNMIASMVPKEHRLWVAATGPWNASIKYEGNERGDWVQHTVDVLKAIDPKHHSRIGVALHTYSHGHDPNLVWSDAKMGGEFTDRYYNVKCLEDYLNAFKKEGIYLPLCVTEANGDDKNWSGGNNGWCVQFYEYINKWNLNNPMQTVLFACLFRWKDDPVGWSISTRSAVQDDFRNAVVRGYTAA